ncbi:MAG: ABC transporter substrate-binding protein [Pirellulales bacterium]|nr:ABC transporter substrate-binding protein [Pirellulales bacterium]
MAPSRWLHDAGSRLVLQLLGMAIVVALLAGSYWAKGRLDARADARRAERRGPERIVSLAPSATETLFALGLGDRVVGVSRYCLYPPAAREKPHVGGLADLNVEGLVALRPTLVVMLAGDRSLEPTFDALGIDTLVVEHRTVEGVFESIPTIGRRCGASDRADRLVTALHARLKRVEDRLAGRPRPRVFVAVDRIERGGGGLCDVYAVGGGPDLHLNAVLTLAGGRNALEGTTIAYPVVSTEGILQTNPEVIVELMPPATDEQRAAWLGDWQRVDRTPAVQRGRVYALTNDCASVPGPRLVLAVEQLARLLHPDAGWDGAEGH